jgi:MFS family permease
LTADATAESNGTLGQSRSAPPLPRADGSGAQRHFGLALIVICAAQTMVILDTTIANIALPFIGQDLVISRANLQWVVTGYALSFGGLLLLGGRLGDLYGRRRIFVTGLTLFVLASGLGGFAQNEPMLLSSRALQGLGAALALITTTFPAGPRRNRAESESRRGQLDLRGAISGTLGLVSVIYGINRAGQDAGATAARSPPSL